jgi:type IV secretory pathway VirB10-like protein
MNNGKKLSKIAEAEAVCTNFPRSPFEINTDASIYTAFLPPSVTTGSPNVRTTAEKAEKPKAKTHIPRVPEPGPRPNVNPELDSFEAVMKALDAELLQYKSMKPSAKPSSLKGKGKTKEDSNAMAVDENDIETAMDAELKETLQDAESDSEEPMDYNMIKNFLESYKSQAGLSGPVSNLAGRLQPGMKLPRDDV